MFLCVCAHRSQFPEAVADSCELPDIHAGN